MQNGDKGRERNPFLAVTFQTVSFQLHFCHRCFVCLFFCHQKSNNSDIGFDCSKLAIDGILSRVVDLEQSAR